MTCTVHGGTCAFQFPECKIARREPQLVTEPVTGWKYVAAWGAGAGILFWLIRRNTGNRT